ncbi:MAG: thioredoxin family protein [Kiritimatiellales bacterium]|nr:thioredoxin family protein [Kiritimatiellales bacterium]
MKKWFGVLGAVVLLGSTVLAGEGWETDFSKASAKAKAENKYMLLDFSGSDWCGWCIKLDNEVFSKGEFKQYAKENLVLVMLDFPRNKSKQGAEVIKQNDELAKKFGIRGFPTVIILNPAGKPVAQTGYQDGGPVKYVEHIKGLIAKDKK